jgi:hypothetical protein
MAAAARLTPQGTRGVLSRQRLVKAHSSGRTQLYELNAGLPLASSLVARFQDEQGRRDALMGSIREVLERHGPVGAAWLYGSIARGDDGGVLRRTRPDGGRRMQSRDSLRAVAVARRTSVGCAATPTPDVTTALRQSVGNK